MKIFRIPIAFAIPILVIHAPATPIPAIPGAIAGPIPIAFQIRLVRQIHRARPTPPVRQIRLVGPEYTVGLQLTAGRILPVVLAFATLTGNLKECRFSGRHSFSKKIKGNERKQDKTRAISSFYRKKLAC